MQGEKAIRTAFVISFLGHCLLLGMPGFGLKQAGEVMPEETVVKIEIETPSALPKIDLIGEDAKAKETEKEEERASDASQDATRPNEDSASVPETAKEAMLRYQDMIKRRIEGAVRYPSWARTQGIEGEALVKFIVSSSGKAGEVSILNGTGFKILDDDAVNTIKRAGPFPPFPKDVRGDSAVIELSILYTLNKGSDHWTRPLDEELCNI